MKKVMLILVLLAVCGCVVADEPETKTEIVAGQVWKNIFSGNEHEILEVGEKYVVYCYANGTYKSPDAKTKESFYECYEFARGVSIVIEDIANSCVVDMRDITFSCASEDSAISYFVTTEPQKPYLYKNLNNDHWMCSKHGDLEPDSMIVTFAATLTSIEDITYCSECFWEVCNQVLGEHIIGIKEQ